MRNYIFDIDGTLTPSRLPIDKKFESFFINWMKHKNVYLVTGSDKEKTIEQIGEIIWNGVKKVYQSCGNQVWKKGVLIKEVDFYLTKEVQRELNIFYIKTIHTTKAQHQQVLLYFVYKQTQKHKQQTHSVLLHLYITNKINTTDTKHTEKQHHTQQLNKHILVKTNKE